MKKQSMNRDKHRNQEQKTSAGLRGRSSQHKEQAIEESFADDIPRPGPSDQKTETTVSSEFIDSIEPPPPQERRTRSHSDSRHGAKSKNTGIKGRDRSGAKHTRAERQSAHSRGA
jgi:hypothetical protein